MNKKFFIFPLLILSLFIMSGCSNNKTYYFKEDGVMTTVNPAESDNVKISADKVQLFMFHSTARCATCIAIGQLASATVNEYFSDELRSGQIEFREVNVDLPENKELAEKFQASGSSLKINAMYDNQDHISEDITVWRLTSNTEEFKNYLKDKLNNILDK